MSSDVYKRLMKQAQKEKISLVNSNSILLKQLYEEVADDLLKKAATAKGGFTKAWLNDYSKYVDYRYKELNNNLTKLTIDGLKSSAEVASAVEGNFLSYINNKYELDIPKEFVKDMYHVNQEAILRMISGSFYENGCGVSKLIWKYSENQKGDINYIIAKGIAEQKPYSEIIKDLEKYIDPNAKKDWDFSRVYPNLKNGKKANVDYNAQRLLRTSINHTFFNQMISNANKNPFVEAVHWELSSAHHERQVKRFGEDICDEYTKQDNYGLGTGNFPKDNVPTPHPCCLCYQYPVNAKSLDEIAEDLRAWVNGGSNSRLDKWLQEYKESA